MAKKNQIEETKVEKEMTAIREESLQKQEVRKTFSELAAHLTKEGKFEVKANQVLVISDMDVSDFLEAAMTLDLNHRLNVLGKALNRFSLDLILEGSIGLGEFNSLRIPNSYQMASRTNKPLSRRRESKSV